MRANDKLNFNNKSVNIQLLCSKSLLPFKSCG